MHNYDILVLYLYIMASMELIYLLSVMTVRHINQFHLGRLRNYVMNIMWSDKVPDTEVLKRTKMVSIDCMIMRVQLRWTGFLVP